MPKEITQSVEDGGQFPKAEYPSIQPFILADRKTVGSPYSPSYWAEEIAVTIRDYGSGDPNAAVKNVIARAKETGLSKDQEKMIYWLLQRYGVPVDVDAPKEKPEVESDSMMLYTQKQVAASLTKASEVRKKVIAFLKVASYYRARKDTLKQTSQNRVARYVGEMELGEAKTRIASYSKNGWTKTEILENVREILAGLSDATIKRVSESLTPTEVRLSSRKNSPTIKNLPGLSNREGLRKAQRIIIENSPRFLTDAQTESLTRLAKRFATTLPFWFVEHSPVQVLGLTKDKQILKASVHPNGKTEHSVVRSNRLATLLRKNPETEVAWVKYCAGYEPRVVVAGKSISTFDLRHIQAQLGQAVKNYFNYATPNFSGAVQQGKEMVQRGTQWAADKINQHVDKKQTEERRVREVQNVSKSYIQRIVNDLEIQTKDLVEYLKRNYGYQGPEIESWFRKQLSNYLGKVVNRTAGKKEYKSQVQTLKTKFGTIGSDHVGNRGSGQYTDEQWGIFDDLVDLILENEPGVEDEDEAKDLARSILNR